MGVEQFLFYPPQYPPNYGGNTQEFLKYAALELRYTNNKVSIVRFLLDHPLCRMPCYSCSTSGGG